MFTPFLGGISSTPSIYRRSQVFATSDKVKLRTLVQTCRLDVVGEQAPTLTKGVTMTTTTKSIFRKQANEDGTIPQIYFEESDLGYWIQSFNGHSSVIRYIAIYDNRISIKWNDTTYWYEGADNAKVLAKLLVTGSLGKVANYVKQNATVTHKFVRDSESQELVRA